MTNLNHYLRLWNLSDPEPLAETPTSHVYIVRHNGERVVLKVLTPIGVEDEFGGMVALKHYDGHGAVRLLNADDGAHLLEYVEGEELAQMVYRGDDVKAAEIIADVLNKLHRTQPNPPPTEIQTLRRRFRSLFQKAEADAATGDESVYVRGAKVAEILLSAPQDERMLHGDMHHHNVKWHPERGWLAYDPKGVYGERTFDAANVLCNPLNASELVRSEARFLTISQLLAERMGIAVGRLRAYTFAYTCLSVAWGLEDGNAEDWMQDTLTVGTHAERHMDLSG